MAGASIGEARALASALSLVEPHGETDIVCAELLGQSRHELEQGRPAAAEIVSSAFVSPPWRRLDIHEIRGYFVEVGLAFFFPVNRRKFTPQHPRGVKTLIRNKFVPTENRGIVRHAAARRDGSKTADSRGSLATVANAKQTGEHAVTAVRNIIYPDGRSPPVADVRMYVYPPRDVGTHSRTSLRSLVAANMSERAR